MNQIRAIETEYKGYRFRSRLEARWAVFFDTLEVRYEYEKEGYDLGEYGYYLPDFWLPDYNCFVEIKPLIPNLRELDTDYFKCSELAKLSRKMVILVGGSPSMGEGVEGYDYYPIELAEYNIAVFLADFIPDYYPYSPNGLKTYYGRFLRTWHMSRLKEHFYTSSEALYGFLYSLSLDEDWKHLFRDSGLPHRGEALDLIRIDQKYHLERYGEKNDLINTWVYGIAEDGFCFGLDRESKLILIDEMEVRGGRASYPFEALKRAKQARFEYGEKG